MALQKRVDTKFGVAAEYHKIMETHIDWYRQIAKITVGVFVDEAARREGSRPIETRNYLSDGVFPFDVNEPVLMSAYMYLKTLAEFADAVDVLEDNGTTTNL